MHTNLPRSLAHAPTLQKKLKRSSEKYWIKRGEKMALKLFHEMAEQVPAYRKFLNEHDIYPAGIKTAKDLAKVPTVNKDNYLRKHPRVDLCWGGSFGNGQWVISTTSGSTGEPFYFPRTKLQDQYYALTAELYLREVFNIQSRKTLYIDAFAMGAWIGGVFTYEAIKQVAQKGYDLSIITPGINKQEVVNSVKQLGGDFDQIIIGCYPPIMRDIIDLGIDEGIDWTDYNVGLVHSAEGFSEEFRDYLCGRASLSSPYTTNLNHYGTVDLGTMSHETPLSILIRKQAVQDRALFRALFGNIHKQPTLTQYMPEMFYFEEQEGRVICSSRSGIPLVRYDLKDNGGVLTLAQVEVAYREAGKNLDEELKKAGIEKSKWNLPFVYLYERSDFSVTFTGAQIYPEEVRRALLDKAVENSVTSKLTMITGYDKKANNYLEVHVELRKGVEPSTKLQAQITDLIVKNLLAENSEYGVLYGEYKEKLHPRVTLWPYEHPLHFGGGGKQKWVKTK